MPRRGLVCHGDDLRIRIMRIKILYELKREELCLVKMLSDVLYKVSVGLLALSCKEEIVALLHFGNFAIEGGLIKLFIG